MNQGLDKIGAIPLAVITIAANLMQWMVDNEVFFWISSLTIVVSAYLALRKFIITTWADLGIIKKKIRGDDPPPTS